MRRDRRGGAGATRERVPRVGAVSAVVQSSVDLPTRSRALATVVAAVVAIALAVSSSAPAPTQFAMVVSGTALAPGAHGSATLTKTGSGWRIELSATGLPRLANGRYYEAWLKNAAGVLVPVGTFNDARQVTLWAGVPPTDFRRSPSPASRPTATRPHPANACSSEP